MIGVGRIIIGRQDGREQIAGAGPHFSKEGSFRSGAAPVTQHGDGTPIGEAKGQDVDRIGRSMFAEAPV